VRTNGGEIGELLGVDLGQWRGTETLDESAKCGARGVSGVVPSGEGGNDMGPTKFGSANPSNVFQISHYSTRYRPKSRGRMGARTSNSGTSIRAGRTDS
jgi:hypothetical protein